MNNPQSRKWILVINNPLEAGLNHEAIIENLHKFSPAYFCLADEIASTGTHHTHVFLYAPSPIRFSTIKRRFPTAHIERAYGSTRDNRDYIAKSGSWADTEKAETSVPGTFQEWGDIPTEKQEKSPEMFLVMQSLRAGKSTMEILEEHPNLAFRIRDIEVLRQNILSDIYIHENRQLEVSYLYGASGAGKTRSIFDENGSENVCRITDYGGLSGVRFDAYHGQRVLVFEEFNSQIPIYNMLNYLDIYPTSLPARYTDRVACFQKVYMTSNLPLEAQYLSVQWENPETWKAFLRRIHNVVEYRSDGTKIFHRKGGKDLDQ